MTSHPSNKLHSIEFPTDIKSIPREGNETSGLYESFGVLPEGTEENALLKTFAAYLARYSNNSAPVFYFRTNKAWSCRCFEVDSTRPFHEISACAVPLETIPNNGVSIGLALEPVTRQALAASGLDYVIYVNKSRRINCFFNPKYFLQEAIQFRITSFSQILNAARLNPKSPAGALPLATLLDKKYISSLANETSRTTITSSICEQFSQQAFLTPHLPAVRFKGQTTTYNELESRSNQLAHHLISLGVSRGSVVGILLQRSTNAIVSMLAVQKTGARYLPLDSSYPIERIEYIVEDSSLDIAITDSELAAKIQNEDLRKILIDHIGKILDSQPSVPPKIQVPSSSGIYYIYTSGTTGKPKGVDVSHQHVNTYVHSQNEVLQQPHGSRTIALASFCFDVSTAEIYCTLLTGGCVVLATRKEATNPTALAKLIKDENVDLMHATPSTWRLLLESGWRGHELLAITFGEPFPFDMIAPLTALTRSLWNFYGPTETTVYASCYQIHARDQYVHIGTPLPNYSIEIRDALGLPCAFGVPGELWIGGLGVSNGYVNKPDLNNQKFVATGNQYFYKTGDLARLQADGNIEYMGRIDSQIKFNGYRIELGEIETILTSHPQLKRAVAGVLETGTDKQLVAWLLPEEGQSPSMQVLKDYLHNKLPTYMTPTSWYEVDFIPLNANGKVDKQALNAIGVDLSKSVSANLQTTDSSDIKIDTIATDLWHTILGLPTCDSDASFFDLGGTSMLALNYVNQLNTVTSKNFNIVDLFNHPTLAKWLDFLEKYNIESVQFVKKTEDPTSPTKDIAIVGMAVHVPGASNLEKFWENLVNGIESITQFSEEQLCSEQPAEIVKYSQYVPIRGVIENYDKFDNEFFGMSPREAKVTDPQQRLFLQTAWHALEDAGHVADKSNSRVGVFAGNYYNTYHVNNVSAHQDIVHNLGHLQEMIASEKDYIAPRVAHLLDLKGPAISIHTACSTSMVAISQACINLKHDQCDVALAGAASLTSPTLSGHEFQEDGVFSKDGHTRTFSQYGSGTTFSDGVGAVVLKRLDDAIANHDRIYAVIKAATVNNDGGGKMSFMSPSSKGQAAVVESALQESGVSADSISYVEAHGTATVVGDPIEIEGLRQAFSRSTNKTQFCAIGSIKSNIGHLTAAAGVASLIKVALSLHKKQIPPTLHSEPTNPAIKFEQTPFFPLTKTMDWETNSLPRRAGVSSFGVGGTNAHAILEEYESLTEQEPSEQRADLLLISAKSEQSLATYTENLAQYLEDHNPPISDIAYTLSNRRTALPHRRFVVTGQDRSTTASRLRELQRESSDFGNATKPHTKIAFMFPGQGCQYAGMGTELYNHHLVFRDSVDLCAKLLSPYLEIDIRALIVAKPTDQSETNKLLQQTQYAQPSLFVMGYALSKLWESWGIKPSAVLGHSVGELVAAQLAGVFSLADALMLVASRGEIMFSLPEGSMASVRATREKVEDLLNRDLSIAAINGPKSYVVSGHTQAITQFIKTCESKEIACKKLQTSHAFHSQMMNPAVDLFTAKVSDTHRSPAQLPVMSTATASWLSDTEAMNPKYWGRHLRDPVRFAESIKNLWSESNCVLLELGPRATASTLALQQITDPSRQIAFSSMQQGGKINSELESIYFAAGKLWTLGFKLNWQEFRKHKGGKHCSLPGYAFEKNRHWLESRHQQKMRVRSNQKTSRAIERASLSAQKAKSKKLPSEVAITKKLREIFESSTDRLLNASELNTNFMSLGMDSLALIQFSNAVKDEFSFRPSLRQLMESLDSISALSTHIGKDFGKSIAVERPHISTPTTATLESSQLDNTLTSQSENSAQGLLFSSVEQSLREQLSIAQQQLHVLSQQLDTLTKLRSTQNIESRVNEETVLYSEQPESPKKQLKTRLYRASIQTIDQVNNEAATPAESSTLGMRHRLVKQQNGNSVWHSRNDATVSAFCETKPQ